MSTTTANMGLTVPTLNGDPGVWDTGINATINLLDLHDHTSGKGVKVPSAGINVNADLTFAGYSLTNLRAAVFTAQASFATAKSLYVKDATGDIYYRDGASNEVRLTASGALNIATTGGITGDYIAAGAALYYDDANKTYRLLRAAPLPNVWARVACGGVDIYELGSGITTRVRLSSPAALAASYEVVWPDALPADTSLFQITSAGVMTFSNTVAKAVTMSELTTFTVGATAAANQHFTVSGTGRYKHGTFTKMISPLLGVTSGTTFGSGYIQSSGAGSLYVPITLDVGERLTAVEFRYYGNASLPDMTYELNVYDSSAVKTTLGSGALNNVAAAWFTETPAAGHTLATGETIVMEFTFANADMRVGAITAAYTYP
jgi:hypothetical protein